MLNKTNTFETDKSTEKFTQNTFPDKRTIEHLKQKDIPSIQDHLVQIFKETLKLQQNFKNNTPNITDALKTIQNSVNQILKETQQIKQILKNMANATNALETNTSFKEITLEQTKQIVEVLNKPNTLETNKSSEKFTQNIFPDKNAIQQLNETSIQSIIDHSIQMYKKTLKLLQNLKNNAPNITDALKTIQNSVNQILIKTIQIKQILKKMPNTTNALKTSTSSKEITLEQTKQIVEVLKKTNMLETNKSSEKFTQNIFPDKHTIDQLYQKSIQSIQDRSIQMCEETLKLQQNLKNNAPNIRNALKTIQDYINRILKETGQIEQILKNTPDTTNALETDTSFKEYALEQVKQLIEETKQIEQILNK